MSLGQYQVKIFTNLWDTKYNESEDFKLKTKVDCSPKKQPNSNAT